MSISRTKTLLSCGWGAGLELRFFVAAAQKPQPGPVQADIYREVPSGSCRFWLKWVRSVVIMLVHYFRMFVSLENMISC